MKFELEKLGATEMALRSGDGKDGPVITEQANLILDARFAEIGAGLEKEISAICGVLEAASSSETTSSSSARRVERDRIYRMERGRAKAAFPNPVKSC